MASPNDDVAVTVYWRPGCPYCATLRWRLRRLGVATTEVDIWSEPTAAGEVRRITGGSETVPTVVVGEGAHMTAMVNPSAQEVRAAVRRFGLATTARPADATGTGPDPESDPQPKAPPLAWLRRMRRVRREP